MQGKTLNLLTSTQFYYSVRKNKRRKIIAKIAIESRIWVLVDRTLQLKIAVAVSAGSFQRDKRCLK